MFPDDDLAQPFMREAEPVQVVVVEEMTERPVPDVMHQRRDSQEFFDKVRRGNVGHGLLEEWIEMARKPAGHVHRAERVHKARVFRRGIDPAGALQLIDITQPLDPRRIDQIFFSAALDPVPHKEP